MINFTTAELECIEDLITDAAFNEMAGRQNSEILKILHDKVWTELRVTSRKALFEKKAPTTDALNNAPPLVKELRNMLLGEDRND